MKRILLSSIILICLLVTGCDRTVNRYELDGYNKACKNRGGIFKIDNFHSTAICVDGSTVIWKGE